MIFFKVKQAECDFCKNKKDVVTQVDDVYICTDCAKEILEHCIVNELSLKNVNVKVVE